MNLFEDQDEDTCQISQLQERISRLGLFDRSIVLCGIGIPVAILWTIWLEWEALSSDNGSTMIYFGIGALIGLLIGLPFGIRKNRKVVRSADLILESVDQMQRNCGTGRQNFVSKDIM